LDGTPAIDKCPHFQHSHLVFERDRNHVTGSHHAAWREDARAIHPDMTVTRERRRGSPRTHHAGMPQPSVDALAINLSRRHYSLVEHDLFGPSFARRSGLCEGRNPASTFPDHALATVLGFGFKLSLQRRELGERRIRIGRLLAPLVPPRMGRWPLALAARTIEPLLGSVPATVARVASSIGRIGRRRLLGCRRPLGRRGRYRRGRLRCINSRRR